MTEILSTTSISIDNVDMAVSQCLRTNRALTLFNLKKSGNVELEIYRYSYEEGNFVSKSIITLEVGGTLAINSSLEFTDGRKD